MEECVYFTRRVLGEGKAMAWVLRQPCPKCGKAQMGKPKDKTGKVLVRAKEYVCPSCNHTVDKHEYEATLTCNIIYTCPACKKSGEASVPFQRKVWEGVPAIVFECSNCNKKLGITKKLKEGKKGKVAEDTDDDF